MARKKKQSTKQSGFAAPINTMTVAGFLTRCHFKNFHLSYGRRKDTFTISFETSPYKQARRLQSLSSIKILSGSPRGSTNNQVLFSFKDIQTVRRVMKLMEDYTSPQSQHGGLKDMPDVKQDDEKDILDELEGADGFDDLASLFDDEGDDEASEPAPKKKKRSKKQSKKATKKVKEAKAKPKKPKKSSTSKADPKPKEKPLTKKAIKEQLTELTIQKEAATDKAEKRKIRRQIRKLNALLEQ